MSLSMIHKSSLLRSNLQKSFSLTRSICSMHGALKPHTIGSGILLRSAPFILQKRSLSFFKSTQLNSTEPQLNLNVNTNTVDAEEVAKFGAMSKEWWDPNGSCKLLHSMNLPRVEYILNSLKIHGLEKTSYDCEKKEFLEDPYSLNGLKILDVGCGGGLLSESLARLGAKVTAIDASPENILIARLHQKKDPLLNDIPDRLLYFCETSHELLAKLGPSYFDIVCSLEVIEHVNEPQEFINSLSNLVKPGGPVFLSTINKNLLSYALTIGFAEHILKLVPVGTHHYEKYIRPENLRTMMSISNLKTRDMTTIHFNPLQQQWSLGSSFYGSPSNGSFSLEDLGVVNYITLSTRSL